MKSSLKLNNRKSKVKELIVVDAMCI